MSLRAHALARQIDPGVTQEIHSLEADSEAEGIDRLELLRRSEQRPAYFDYQRELVAAGFDVLLNGKRALISLPTGGGKTRTAVGAVLDLHTYDNSSSTIWIAPTIELLDQAHDTLVSMWRMHGSVGDIRIIRKAEAGSPRTIWLTTPQGLSAVDDISRLGGWRSVVFDEAHQIAAPTFSEATTKVLSHNVGCGLLGLSATPGRRDTGEIETLAEMFNRNLLVSHVLGTNPVRFLQRRGVLSRLQFRQVESAGSWISPGLARSVAAVDSVSKIVESGRRVLVFAQSVAESEALAYVLNGRGIAAAHVDGQLPDAIRRDRVSRFANGRVAVLVNQKLLSTGYDCPAVSDVLVVPRVASPILFEQMVGRAARGPRTGGAGLSTIWQFDDHLGLHGLPQSYYRYKDYEWTS